MSAGMMQGGRLSVPLPKELRTNERDRRGYPIPFIVMRDKHGRPHFTINDQAKVDRCAKKRLCGLCGKRMGDQVYFIGGERCFTDPRGAFIDPPSHRDCAVYALRVCPYLAAPSYGKRIDGRTLDEAAIPDAVVVVGDDTMRLDRPARFGFGAARSFRLVPAPNGSFYFVVDAWEHVEYWKDGAPA